MHSSEQSNKRNQCDFASSKAGNLMRHLKTHSEKVTYASFRADPLRKYLKTHSGVKSKNDIRDVGSTADLVLVFLVLLVPTGTHWYPLVLLVLVVLVVLVVLAEIKILHLFGPVFTYYLKFPKAAARWRCSSDPSEYCFVSSD